MLASKHFSCPAKTGRDFVRDKENPIPAADLPQCPDIAPPPRPPPPQPPDMPPGPPHPPRRSLHQRLHDQGRERIPFGSELFFGFADRALQRFFLAQTLEVAKHVGRSQAQHREKQTLVKTVKGL